MSARATILARQGRIEEAEELAREAVKVGELTDFMNTRADALIDLAQILQRAGQVDEANAVVAEGLALYEQKGNTVAAGKTRDDLIARSKLVLNVNRYKHARVFEVARVSYLLGHGKAVVSRVVEAAEAVLKQLLGNPSR